MYPIDLAGVERTGNEASLVATSASKRTSCSCTKAPPSPPRYFARGSPSLLRAWVSNRIDLYPLLRNYDVWGVIVGTNWNSKRRRMAERSGKTSVFLESSSWKRRRNPRKVLLGEYFAYLT